MLERKMKAETNSLETFFGNILPQWFVGYEIFQSKVYKENTTWIKENSPFFGFSNLFDQTWKLTKTQHVKFASQKEPFQEHMSVGAKFLDDLLHLESVVFWTSKKLPWGATVPPYLPFWTARLFLRLNSFDFKDIFTQKLTQIKLISTKKQHFSSVRQMGGRSFTSSNKHIQNKGGNI